MFGLLEYFYPSLKLDISAVNDNIDEHEIIDSYKEEIKEEIKEEEKVEEPKLIFQNFSHKNMSETQIFGLVEPINFFPNPSAVSSNKYNGSIRKKLLENLNKESGNIMYLVLKKSTREPLGIYDSLRKAKENGQKSTYYDCSILKFKVNDNCKYFTDSMFEDD